MRTVLTHVLHVLSKGLRVAVRSGSINDAYVRSMGFGFWQVRTQDSDHARSGRISYGNQHLVETGENHEKKMF